MGKIKDTLKLAVETLVPGRYPDLSERFAKTAVLYVAKILLIAVLVMSVASLPLIVILPSTIDEHFAKFTKLKLSGDIEMTSAIRLPEKNTQIVIDTTGNTTSITAEKLLINKDALYYKPIPFLDPQMIKLSSLGDMVGNKWFFKSLIITLTLLMIPGILLALYLVLLVKYLLTALIAGTLAFVLFDLTKFKLQFRKMFKTACYATTPMILLEVIPLPYGINYLIPMPFTINFYLIPLLAYAVLFVIAVMTIQWRHDRRFDESKKAYVRNR